MKATRLGPALIASLALAVFALPALAQHHGGGSRGGHGGGHRGGGYAVPRSGGSYRGGGPVARHPSTGGGHYGGYGHSGGYGRYGGYYGGHRGYGHYGSYYGGRYYGGYPYYRPYYYGSLSFGWPYYSSPHYYSSPYSSAYAYAPSVSVSYNEAPSYASDERPVAPRWDAEREPAPAEARDSGWVRVEVRPEDTSVYVDDQFRGTARESRSLELAPGFHTIELVRPGYVTERRELRVATGGRYDLSVELQRPR